MKKAEKKNIWQTAKELMAENKHGEALELLVSEGIPEDHADFYIKHNGKTAKSELKKEGN
jgi:hypothetical protein